jgi:hypothetical protein
MLPWPKPASSVCLALPQCIIITFSMLCIFRKNKQSATCFWFRNQNQRPAPFANAFGFVWSRIKELLPFANGFWFDDWNQKTAPFDKCFDLWPESKHCSFANVLIYDQNQSIAPLQMFQFMIRIKGLLPSKMF